MTTNAQLEQKCNRLMMKLVDQEEELRNAHTECELLRVKLTDLQADHAVALQNIGSLKSQQEHHFMADTVEAALSTLLHDKSAEIDALLRSFCPVEDNGMREVEKAFSDACDVLVAHPHDFCTPTSFLNFEKVSSILTTNPFAKKNELVQSLVRTLHGLVQYSPDGTLLLNVPKDCLPVDAIVRVVAASADILAQRVHFEDSVQHFNLQVDSTKDFSLQTTILRNTLEHLADRMGEISTTNVSFEAASAPLEYLVVEANKIDSVVSDNICMLKHKCGRARGETQRRLMQLEKEVQECDDGMQQSKAKVAELAQEVEALLQQINEVYSQMTRNAQRQVDLRGQMAICSSFSVALSRREDTEVTRQNNIREGAKTALILCSKVKEIFRRETEKVDETMKKHKDSIRRTELAVHERMYKVCQEQFEQVSRLCVSHRRTIRMEQQKLQSANRIVSTGILTEDIERKVQDELMLTGLSKISVAKEALAAAEAEIEAVKAVLASTNTMMEVGKSSSFLDEYETFLKTENISNKLEDLVVYMKSASELMMQCVDGDDSACSTAVQTCLSESAICLLELRSHVPRLQQTDEGLRNTSMTKLKRYRRMIADSLRDLEDSGATLYEKLHALVSDVMSQVDDVVASLTTPPAGPGIPPDYVSPATGLQPSSIRREPFTNRQHFGSRRASEITTFVAPDFGESDQDFIDLSLSGTASIDASRLGTPTAILSRAATPTRHPMPPSTPILPTVQPPTSAVIPMPTPLVFGRHTQKLSVMTGAGGPSKRIRKVVGPMEVSDSCALASIGFSRGRHLWRVKLGQRCDGLMVGVCDGGMPVDGYCNSLRYKNCYFLHLGTGALWSPLLGMQRVPYAEGPMCNAEGEVTVLLDLDAREISFGWGRTMMPPAFRGIQLPPGGDLYPCFEVYNNGCEFEFVE